MNTQQRIKQTGRTVKMITLLIGLTFTLAAAVEAATYHVTTTADNGNNANPTQGSLRKAVLDANASAGTDTIDFNIAGSGVQTITPPVALPVITGTVIINGTTQPGFSGAPLIELNGINAGEARGLDITAANCVIRGLIINRFGHNAIWLHNGANNNVIAGNYIGTNSSGSASADDGLIHNNGAAIWVETANNIIGGITPADRNIISGNILPSGGTAIVVVGSAATGNKIIGNYIGTDVTGTVGIGNSSSGVTLGTNSASNIVGGPTAAERNVIVGSSHGIFIISSSNNRIQGNYLGVKADGTGGDNSLRNNVGIGLTSAGANDNLIGGTNAGEGNIIANSLDAGIAILHGVNNAVLGNSIYSSGNSIKDYLGIDLGSEGVNFNDAGDADTGANNLQNFPVLTSVMTNGANTVIQGTLNSEANKTYRIELFSNTQCDSSNHGEGRYFITTTNVNTNANGDASFNFTLPTASLNGAYFTATATDPNNNTSEFSHCGSEIPLPAGSLEFTSDYAFVYENGGKVTVKINRVNGSNGAVSVHYATSDGDDFNPAKAPGDYTPKSGTLTFADSETSKTIEIPIIDDQDAEGGEFFFLKLSNPTGGVALTSQDKITIYIEDNDQPTVSINDVSVAEGNSGTTKLNFTVSLTKPSLAEVQISFKTEAGGTATPWDDYEPVSTMVSIPPGQLSQQVTVLVNGDTVKEPDETLSITLFGPSNAEIGKSMGIATIVNDDTAPTSTVQFSQPSYNVTENVGGFPIVVTRTGDLSTAATVKYITNDPTDANYQCSQTGTGTASRKCDYHIAAGTLRFAPGEASKQFILSVVDDVYVEGPEILTLRLGSPSGTGLGQDISVFVTINDDDTPGKLNPVGQTGFFVRQLYVDLLSREPDPAGLTGWTNRIDLCGQPGQAPPPCDRVTVAGDGFMGSAEFFDRQFFVIRLYRTGLGRIPGYGEVADFANVSGFLTPTELELSKQELVAAIMARPEFGNLNQINNWEFVDKLVATAGVNISEAEREALSIALDTNVKTKAQVFREISERAEVKAKYLHEAQVVSAYYGFFSRNPDGAYLIFLQRLDNGEITLSDLANAFVNSIEYHQRFGQ